MFFFARWWNIIVPTESLRCLLPYYTPTPSTTITMSIQRTPQWWCQAWATPTLVIQAKSRNRPSPSIVHSPAKTSPFTKWINDDNCRYYPQQCTPSKYSIATARAASLPPVARAEGTSAAVSALYSQMHDNAQDYICLHSYPGRIQYLGSTLPRRMQHRVLVDALACQVHLVSMAIVNLVMVVGIIVTIVDTNFRHTSNRR